MRASFIFILLGCLVGTANAAGSDLTVAVQNVRSACGGISAELGDMKKMAGINTAVTAVGTVAGGVGLGTGIAKAGVDKKADKLEAELQAEIDLLNRLAQKQDKLVMRVFDYSMIPLSVGDNDNDDDDAVFLAGAVEKTKASGENAVALHESIKEKKEELDELTKKSKNLGNWRTGMMATSTATNIAGTIIASGNRVKGDLKEQINECLVAVKNLSDARMQARIDGSATDVELSRVENIIRACEEWEMVDVSSINKKASGAAISGGIGAGLGLAGTVTSAMANTDDVRSDNTASGKNKEKTLNTASNILAGGTTVASATATVFNATQISAIKRAVIVADQCEEVLK